MAEARSAEGLLHAACAAGRWQSIPGCMGPPDAGATGKAGRTERCEGESETVQEHGHSDEAKVRPPSPLLAPASCLTNRPAGTRTPSSLPKWTSLQTKERCAGWSPSRSRRRGRRGSLARARQRSTPRCLRSRPKSAAPLRPRNVVVNPPPRGSYGFPKLLIGERGVDSKVQRIHAYQTDPYERSELVRRVRLPVDHMLACLAPSRNPHRRLRARSKMRPAAASHRLIAPLSGPVCRPGAFQRSPPTSRLAGLGWQSGRSAPPARLTHPPAGVWANGRSAGACRCTTADQCPRAAEGARRRRARGGPAVQVPPPSEAWRARDCRPPSLNRGLPRTHGGPVQASRATAWTQGQGSAPLGAEQPPEGKADQLCDAAADECDEGNPQREQGAEIGILHPRWGRREFRAHTHTG